MTRSLTAEEVVAIRQVAERLTQERRLRLLEDLARSTANSATPDGSRVVFEITGYERPAYRGQHSFGVEGELLDKDGSKLSFDLFADENDRLLELELIRWGNGMVLGPDWATLKLY
ncbi:MAG TPA: hypothetical protein PK593_11825 [Thermomicrobiales bacterium]|nr:hypothetical protein [Thermomicrobiales bacterium]